LTEPGKKNCDHSTNLIGSVLNQNTVDSLDKEISDSFEVIDKKTENIQNDQRLKDEMISEMGNFITERREYLNKLMNYNS